jgi:hypothetical protein
VSLWPSRQQWQKWSLPSKLTAIGTLLGAISLALYGLDKAFQLKDLIFNDTSQGSLRQPRFVETEKRSRSFLQLNRNTIDILREYSAIAPGRQFGGNFHSANPGPERIVNAFGYSQAYVENVDEQTDRRVRMLFEKELMPIREQYLAGKIKGPEVGVGPGIWTTVLTPPLTQREVDGIMQGTIRMYFVSWLAWTDLQGYKDSAYDCRWLQAHTLPAPYRKENLVWHFCYEE